MKSKLINQERIEGRVYSHELELKTVKSETKADGTKNPNFGKAYITGSLDVATDDDCLNVVTVNYTFVSEFTNKGTKNSTFAALKNIIENGKCVSLHGKDAATLVRLDTALALNDFYTTRDGQEVLISSKRNEGGFVTIVNSLGEQKNRNTFECDIIINGTKMVEADPEKHITDEYLIVKGGIFNYKKDILPVELVVKNPSGMQYFENLDASPKNIIFTRVWGKIQSQTIVDKRGNEETAFGEAIVKEYERKRKEWVIEGAAKEPYEIGDEEKGITLDEIATALANRETHLADVKKRADDYKNSKESAIQPNVANQAAQTGGFNF